MSTKINSAIVKKIIVENKLSSVDSIVNFIKNNSTNYSFYELCSIIEHCNLNRTQNSAYYTDKELLDSIFFELPDFEKDEINVLEPSVGAGNFLPLIFDKYKTKKINIDVVDIDEDSIKILKCLIKNKGIPNNVKITYYVSDFMDFQNNKKYDLAIGNPPFSKIDKVYKTKHFSKKERKSISNNISSYFLIKCADIADNYCIVMPKNFLNTPEFSEHRQQINNTNIKSIIDFGENGFKGVLVETICIIGSISMKYEFCKVKSITKKIEINQKQDYITDAQLPYWIIYRNSEFDAVFNKMRFGVFNVFRDRQITSQMLKKNGTIRVIKSRNICDDGSIKSIKAYDSYVDEKTLDMLAVKKYMNVDNLYLTPNMTYYPRMIRMPRNVIVNGSVAILIPKENIILNEKQIKYFSSNEYRSFYQVARNYQTRSLNIDSSSVYFFGIIEEC